MTRSVIRTTYGFMAGIIGLFLSSLCLIKVVRASSYLIISRVLIILAETRARTVQEDRCKAWRKGVCLRYETNLHPSYCLMPMLLLHCSVGYLSSHSVVRNPAGLLDLVLILSPSSIRSLFFIEHVSILGCIRFSSQIIHIIEGCLVWYPWSVLIGRWVSVCMLYSSLSAMQCRPGSGMGITYIILSHTPLYHSISGP
jgi:hypothetical protein